MGKTAPEKPSKGAGVTSKMIGERKGMGVVDSSNWRALRVWFHLF